MPQVNDAWRTALVAVAGECDTTRGATFATTPTIIDALEYDEVVIRVSALSLPTATKGKVWVKQSPTQTATDFGYDTDLGGVDFCLEVPKADFVADRGKILAVVKVKSRYVQLDFTTDVTDAAGEATVQYQLRRHAR